MCRRGYGKLRRVITADAKSELRRIRIPSNRVNKRSLTPLLAVLFGSSPYLISINIAREMGYERPVQVTQDETAAGRRGGCRPATAYYDRL